MERGTSAEMFASVPRVFAGSTRHDTCFLGTCFHHDGPMLVDLPMWTARSRRPVASGHGRRWTAQLRMVAIRRSMSAAEATAVGGPPQAERRSAWITPCGLLVRWCQAP